MALQALPPPSDGTALAVQGKVQFLLPVIKDLVLDDDSRYDSDAEAFFQALLVLLLLLTLLTLLLLLLGPAALLVGSKALKFKDLDCWPQSKQSHLLLLFLLPPRRKTAEFLSVFGLVRLPLRHQFRIAAFS